MRGLAGQSVLTTSIHVYVHVNVLPHTEVAKSVL